MTECERVISKTLPACVAFHKPSFLQQLKSATLDPSMVHALLTIASRYVLISPFTTSLALYQTAFYTVLLTVIATHQT